MSLGRGPQDLHSADHSEDMGMTKRKHEGLYWGVRAGCDRVDQGH